MDLVSQLVTSMTIGRPRSYVVEGHAPWGRRYESVPGIGVHVVLEGPAVVIRPDGCPLPLTVGDVVLFPAGQEHGMASAADVTLLAADQEADDGSGAVVLGPDRAVGAPSAVTRLLCGAYLHDADRRHPLVSQLPSVVHLPARLGRHSTLSRVVGLLAEELDGPRIGSRIAIDSLLDLLLVTTLRDWYELNPGRGWAAMSDPAIAEALRHIHEAPERPWTVADLAQAAALSRATFAKRFTDVTGVPPLGYLTWWRMTVAAGLLRDTNRLLADIAGAVGYSSPYAFANAFKRAHGVAPGRYRRLSQPTMAPLARSSLLVKAER